MDQPRKPFIRSAALLCILTAAGVLLVGLILEHWRGPTDTLWNQVSIGDSESSVRCVLGEPDLVFERERAPSDYYISGYGKRERSITGKVLIYRGADMVFYIWLSEEGKVEEVFRGTS